MRIEPDGWWKAALPLARGLTRLAFRMHTIGVENVPPQNGAIVASNHVSFLDSIFIPCAVWEHRRMIRFLAAAEFFDWKVVGWGLRKARQIPVRRGERHQEAIDQAEAWIRAGGLFGIFPEGKINTEPSQGLLPGKRGVARLALHTGVPVIPTATWGGQYRLPRSGLTLERGPLRMPAAVVFGSPLRFETEPSPEDRRLAEVTAEVMAAIEPLVEQAKKLTGLDP